VGPGGAACSDMSREREIEREGGAGGAEGGGVPREREEGALEKGRRAAGFSRRFRFVHALSTTSHHHRRRPPAALDIVVVIYRYREQYRRL